MRNINNYFLFFFFVSLHSFSIFEIEKGRVATIITPPLFWMRQCCLKIQEKSVFSCPSLNMNISSYWLVLLPVVLSADTHSEYNPLSPGGSQNFFSGPEFAHHVEI